LKAKDRTLLAALGLCRALTLDQVVELLGNPRDTRTVHNRLRALAGDTGNVKLPNLGTVMLRRLRFRAFDGAPLVLWVPTHIGLAIAQRELGREVSVSRTDIGVAFAEHFVALTDLFIGLARPYVLAGGPIGELPFLWDVAEDTRLPWREPASDGSGQPRDRAIRPDAVLTLPSARRRIFIECETGTHTLVAFRKDRHQATVHKAQRYETFLAGLADVPNRVTHYAQKYPDGWAAEVLFLVPTEARGLSTEAAIASVTVTAASHATFRVCTLEKALAYLQGLLPAPPELPALRPAADAPLFGPEEHRTVNAFVVESTRALAQANAALRRHGAPEVAGPPSTARMLAFLKKAQAAVHRGREPRTPASHG
jgi:hypothetical protein